MAAGARLIERVGVKEEGTPTEKTPWFCIKTVDKLNRTLDESQLAEVQRQMPAELYEQVIQYKPHLNVKTWHAVEAAHPVFARTITTKPAKPSVSVELKETV